MEDYYKSGIYSFNIVSEENISRLLTHRNSQETWINLTESRPVYPKTQTAWLSTLGNGSFYFEVSVNGMPIGIVRITDIDYVNSNACIGLDIYKLSRGKGHGFNVFKMLIKYCFGVLNLNRLWLLVRHDNIPAIKIYMKNGFRQEGVMRDHLYKDGKYHDYVLMGLLRKEWEYDTSV